MKTLVVSPHPDDELLGCGGTLLRRTAEGGTVGWLLMTAITEEGGWGLERIEQRAKEIEEVRVGLGIDPQHMYQLNLPTAQLDQQPMDTLVSRVSQVFRDFEPEEVLLPHPGDAHSDHRITFEAVSACTKWFRYPSVQRVLTYETLSETDAGLDPERLFRATVFVDISDYLDRKIELMRVYASEMGDFPFPRSERALRVQAEFHGARAGFMAAEVFTLLRERH
ncbi:PIG-L deacetylase family protein [Ectothiorhodospira marina]|uniref:N-acetylglucosaminyl deacetylase, LmbE family n=1 Tax=Ectothiorhodospira marina TaxID=1396821 RepID=A0A1H7IAN9_9GAMM|nr:PIG-L deacetylase family protein [Ectothiorhodospira marina]SEK59566.1 N-acetylglucosaminyl deacetylase, LmbE family [Ectothiorhodospira marina]